MFTQEQFNEFFRLVNLTGSANQADRIDGRLSMPGFVAKVGRDKCDEMWKLIQNGVTPSTVVIKSVKEG